MRNWKDMLMKAPAELSRASRDQINRLSVQERDLMRKCMVLAAPFGKGGVPPSVKNQAHLYAVGRHNNPEKFVQIVKNYAARL